MLALRRGWTAMAAVLSFSHFATGMAPCRILAIMEAPLPGNADQVRLGHRRSKPPDKRRPLAIRDGEQWI